MKNDQRWKLVGVVLVLTVWLGMTVKAAPPIGTITPANSIIGGTASDLIGSGGVIELATGNLVIISKNWNGVGAVTCVTPAEAIAGGIVVSASNSLVGATINDGNGLKVTSLSNGNYVVGWPKWNNGVIADAGAATWVNGSTCIPYGASERGAVVSTSNSLVGSFENNQISTTGITVLTNGNYVVRSYMWHDGTTTNMGAATWGNGTTGTIGVVSASNSLVGSAFNDLVGGDVVALTNGNYVVRSPSWNNGALSEVGAVTWGDGDGVTTGVVSASNSLIGSTAGDTIGSNAVSVLPNGNYVVSSSNWDNGAIVDAGAVTWGDGNTGITGVVSATNSLIGSIANDQVGFRGVTVLTRACYELQRQKAIH